MSDRKYYGKPLVESELDLHKELGEAEVKTHALQRRVEELEDALKKIKLEAEYDSYGDIGWWTSRFDDIQEIIEETL